MPKVCVEFEPDSPDEPTQGARFYSTTVGDGTSTTLSVPHNLNASDVLYTLRDLATGELDAYDVSVNTSDPNTLRLNFATAPAANSVRVWLVAPPAAV